MIIGLIGFGKISQNLVKLIQSEDIEFTTSSEGRSQKTAEDIKKFNVKELNSFEDVALVSDILISANSPAGALDIAKRYGKFTKGIYLDLNNISPKTTLEISSHVDNFVDGAIIGKIDSENPWLYISGEKSDELLFLNEFISTRIISDTVGDVAILKMLRSSYTKSLSAVLIESSQIAQKYGLENEFFDILALTEGNDFREKSISRINNTINNSKRKSEELGEIIDYFDDDLIIVRAAQKRINR